MRKLILFLVIFFFAVPAYAFKVHFTNGAQLEVTKIEVKNNTYKLILPDGKEIYYGKEDVSGYSVVDSNTGKDIRRSFPDGKEYATGYSIGSNTGKEYASGYSIINSNDGIGRGIDDIQEVFVKLKSVYPEKNDYETSNQFKVRINDTSFYKMDFVFLDKTILKWSTKYNAETGYLAVRPFDYMLDPKYIIVDQNLKGDTYLANNAFGATVSVNSYSGNEFGLCVDYASFVFPKINKGYEIAIEPTKAKSLSENLGILYICKLKMGSNPESYWKEDYKFKGATFGSPTEKHIRQNIINVELTSLLVFDKKTGAVYITDNF